MLVLAIYTYDDLNRLTSVTYDNGQKVDYTYDAGGNLLSVQSTGVTSEHYHVFGEVLLAGVDKNNTQIIINGKDISFTGTYGVISNTVYGKIYVGEAGNDKIQYYFDVPTGSYDIVVTNGNLKGTATVTTNSTDKQDLVTAATKKQHLAHL